MIRKIALGFVVLVGAFLGYVALQPSDYVISREVTIRAPAEKVFPYLNNAKLAANWSPWSELDPKAKMSFSGPDEGVGSRTSWADGEKLGTGSATIIESVANQSVRIKLEYAKPFEMTQDAAYSIKSSGGETKVVWSVQGKNTFMGRVMCAFGNMDKMVGGIFEKGLLNLKNLVEKSN